LVSGTSTSSEIDYAYQVGSKHSEGEGLDCTEKLLYGPVIEANEPWSAFLPNVRATDLPDSAKLVAEHPERVVAINAKIMKLNAVFLQMLQLLRDDQAKLGRHIQWQFYPAEKGFGFDGLSSYLEKQLGSVVVYPYQTYPEFLESLAACHLSLVPFPFGNTNSTVDASLLGIPVIFLHGNAPASVGDVLVMERLQCFESAAAHSIEEYYTMAMGCLEGCQGYSEYASALRERCNLELMESGSEYLEKDISHFVFQMKSLVSTDATLTRA